jgi:hypothetical protein
MDTFNRVMLAIIFGLVFIASITGILMTLGILTVQPVELLAVYWQPAGFSRENFLAWALGSMWLLAVVIALGVLWLRGQFLGAVRAVAGAVYEPLGVPGPGFTEVNQNVVGKAIDLVVSDIPGVVRSGTRIYSGDGEAYTGAFLVQTSLTIKRGVDPRKVDKAVRRTINRAWFLRMGSEIVRHDILIGIERITQRVV